MWLLAWHSPRWDRLCVALGIKDLRHGVGPVVGIQYQMAGQGGAAAIALLVLLHVDVGGGFQGVVHMGLPAVAAGGGGALAGVDDGAHALHAGIGGAEDVLLEGELIGIVAVDLQSNHIAGIPADSV